MTTRIDQPHVTSQADAPAAPTDVADTTPARPQSKVSGWGKLALKIVVSAGLVVFLTSRIDLAKMLGEFSRLRWELWALALASHLASQTVSAVRWSSITKRLGFLARRGQLVRWYFEGSFFSLCLPGSIGGDVFKCYRLAGTASDARGPKAVMLAGCTVLADRVAGLLALLSFSVAALAYQQFGFSAAQAIGVLLGCVIMAGLGLRIAGRVFRLASHRLGRFPKLAGLAEKLRPFSDSPRILDRALAWSVLVQFLGMCSLAWVGLAMGLSVPLPAYFVAGGLVALMTTLPVSINGVGVREGGLTLLLAPYGMSSEDGVALGLLWFLVIVAAGLTGGVVYLFRERTPAAVSAPVAATTVALSPAAGRRGAKAPTSRV